MANPYNFFNPNVQMPSPQALGAAMMDNPVQDAQAPAVTPLGNMPSTMELYNMGQIQQANQAKNMGAGNPLGLSAGPEISTMDKFKIWKDFQNG